MKYTRTMPSEQPSGEFPIVSEGSHKFQIVDIFSEDEVKILLKCEVISDVDNGKSILYNVSNDSSNKFFWLTKIFLKCIGEPHTGDVTIDTDAFIGRQFQGEVVHTKGKDGKTYANIRKLIPTGEPQPIRTISESKIDSLEEIQWDK